MGPTNQEKIKEYQNVPNIIIPESASDTLAVQDMVLQLKAFVNEFGMDKNEFLKLEQSAVDTLASTKGGDYVKLYYTLKDDMIGDSFYEQKSEDLPSGQTKGLGIGYESKYGLGSSTTYMEGLNKDITYLNNKITENEEAQEAFLTKYPNFDTFLNGYEMLHSRMGDDEKSGGQYHRYEVGGVTRTEGMVDSNSPDWILDVYGRDKLIRKNMRPWDGWSPIDRWNIYDPSPADPNYQYVMQDSAFTKAYEDYYNIVYEHRGMWGFRGLPALFGAYAGTDDDIFNVGSDGTVDSADSQAQRLEKVTEKYDGWRNKDLIINLWAAANKEFVRVSNELESNINIVRQYKDNYFEPGEDLSHIASLVGLTGVHGVHNIPTKVQKPSTLKDVAADWSAILKENHQHKVDREQLLETLDYITGK